MKKKHARKAARKAMVIARDDAKAKAMANDDWETREKIQNNIVIRSGKTKDKDAIKVRVGVLGGAKGHAAASGEIKGKGKDNPGGDTYYWRFVEFGTARTMAYPFMRPALERNIQKITNVFADDVKAGIAEDVK